MFESILFACFFVLNPYSISLKKKSQKKEPFTIKIQRLYTPKQAVFGHFAHAAGRENNGAENIDVGRAMRESGVVRGAWRLLVAIATARNRWKPSSFRIWA